MCERLPSLKRWLVALCFAFLLCMASLTPTALAEDEMTPRLEGWEYQYAPVSPSDAQTIARTLAEKRWKSTDVPVTPPGWNGKDDLWLRVPITRQMLGTHVAPTLFIQIVDQGLDVLFEGREIYRFGERDSSGRVVFSGYPLHFIPLEPTMVGGKLLFRVGSVHSNIGLGGRIRVGARDTMLEEIFIADFPVIAFASIFFALGLFFLSLYLRNRTEKSTLGSGLFDILVAAYLFLGTGVLKYKVPEFDWWRCHTEIFSLYLSPLAFVHFADSLFPPTNRFHLFRILKVSLYSVVFGSMILVVARVVPLYATLLPWQVVILVGMVIYVTWITLCALNSDVEAKILATGVGLFIFFVSLSVLSAMQVVSRSYGPNFFLVGLALLVLSVAMVVERRFRGIAEKVRLYAKELKTKNEELRRLDLLKDQFLANTSHELRTPLVGILGLAESLLDGAAGPLSQTISKNLSLIVMSGRRLSTLVNDILDFSKLREQRFDLKMEAVDLYSVIDFVMANAAVMVEKKDITLSVAVPKGISAVHADYNRLQQILFNLVGNAIKFTEKGSVVVTARQTDTDVVVCVEDTGLGIAASDLERIFVPFEQGDASTTRKFCGTGLGLSVTKKLVELHHGKIWCESEVGKGSRFFFSLQRSYEIPIPQVERSTPIVRIDDMSPVSDEHGPTMVGAEGCKGSVLVVDDEPVNRQVLFNVLGGAGYKVLEASSGQAALELLASEKNIEVVLLDVMMPGMSGYHVCGELRKARKIDDLPVIFLTAKNQLSNLVEGYEIGGNDYLMKPFLKNELLARVNVQLQLARVSRMLRAASEQMDEVLSATREMSLKGEREIAALRAIEAIMSRVPVTGEMFLELEVKQGSEAGDLLVKKNTYRLQKKLDVPLRVDPVMSATLRKFREEVSPGTEYSHCRFVDGELRFSVQYGGELKAAIVLRGVPGETMTQAEFQFFHVILESLAVALASIDLMEERNQEAKRRDREEKRVLLRMVSLAAMVSDKLNSPLLVAMNSIENLSRIAREGDESGLRTAECKSLKTNLSEAVKRLSGALTQLQGLSQQLSELREVGGRIEATTAMKETDYR